MAVLCGLYLSSCAKDEEVAKACLLYTSTNSIRIILQQMDGVTVDVDNFEFTITDDNGLMNYCLLYTSFISVRDKQLVIAVQIKC